MSGVLAACFAVASTEVWQSGIRVDMATNPKTTEQLVMELSPPSTKEWLSHANVSKRVYASISHDTKDLSMAPGAYFQVLIRLYGASTEYALFEHTSAFEESLPKDEVATFHQSIVHMPVTLARVSSEFGRRSDPFGKGSTFHRGIDLAAPGGTAVHAVAEGTVIKATYERDYGNVVVINHHNGYRTLYAHNSKLLVKKGDKVKLGQRIAKVGSTGRSTGAHLHFEVHCSGHRIDPNRYLSSFKTVINNKAAQI